MDKKSYRLKLIVMILLAGAFTASLACAQDDEGTKKVLKNGLLGAGTGAIAAGASGGNAGTGALIGAGTGAIGGALLDAITTPSSSSSRPRRRSAPPPDDEYYDEEYDDSGDYYYEEPPQESSTQKVLKQGLVGAGTGAIAAGTSGGNAGKGALIGAGTGVIGGALLDMLTTPSQPKKVYRRPPQAPKPRVVTQQAAGQSQQNIKVSEEASGTDGGRKKVIKKYDDTGKLVSEEEVYY
jgi:hypothetical protein